jgi:hypothetical protein
MSQVAQHGFAPRSVAYDGRAVTIDGRRTLIVGGSIHYPRSTPGMWPDLMRRAKEAGLNAIDTYVFWNLHERRRGVYDFSGRLDLVQFLTLAGQHGLNVVLRVGPYVCAETNYGGFPAWLRDVPGIQMRTDNEPFKAEVARWLSMLADLVRPLTAPQGGPVILAQVENEYGLVAKNYGDAGRRYLGWCAERARVMELGVPWVMCVGAAAGVLETINGFYAHEQLDRFFADHPDQPALWTEHWPGWYDLWGYPRSARKAADVAYATARFFAAGGAAVNYYMWHGGTNFGRDGMYLQATSYAFDAPLDEFGLETTKSRHLARLHHILREHADVLLHSPRPTPAPLGEQGRVYIIGGAAGTQGGARPLAFLCNDSPDARAAVSFDGAAHELAPRSVRIVRGGEVLFDTARVEPEIVVSRSMTPLDAKVLSPFEVWREPTPSDWPRPVRSRFVGEGPVEQLRLTRDETDYCWYTTWIDVPEEGGTKARVTIEGVADVIYLFVDGRLRAYRSALVEERGPTTGEAFHWSTTFRISPGDHELQLLCAAVGLVKGDWQIGQQNMADERKGVWGRVLWDGQALQGPWFMAPGLLGERYQLFGPAGELASWRPDPERFHNLPLCWFRTRFDGPHGAEPIAIDLTGMNKGMIWLNGHCVGRYWLAPATQRPPEWLAGAIQSGPPDHPTQRHYHLPAEWLAAKNTLVLFEELGGDPSTVQLCRWA